LSEVSRALQQRQGHTGHVHERLRCAKSLTLVLKSTTDTKAGDSNDSALYQPKYLNQKSGNLSRVTGADAGSVLEFTKGGESEHFEAHDRWTLCPALGLNLMSSAIQSFFSTFFHYLLLCLSARRVMEVGLQNLVCKQPLQWDQCCQITCVSARVTRSASAVR